MLSCVLVILAVSPRLRGKIYYKLLQQDDKGIYFNPSTKDNALDIFYEKFIQIIEGSIFLDSLIYNLDRNVKDLIEEIIFLDFTSRVL